MRWRHSAGCPIEVHLNWNWFNFDTVLATWSNVLTNKKKAAAQLDGSLFAFDSRYGFNLGYDGSNRFLNQIEVFEMRLISAVTVLFFCLLTASELVAQNEKATEKASQPNIVFVFSDDHAVNAISSYGGRLKDVAPTPNIDRIAREGAIFRNSFCANSICGPSRACILTGKHSHVNGFMRNGNKFDSSQWTFIKDLKADGYSTAVVGKWHLKSNPVGFDFWEILPGQGNYYNCLLYTSPSPRDATLSRMPSSA